MECIKACNPVRFTDFSCRIGPVGVMVKTAESNVTVKVMSRDTEMFRYQCPLKLPVFPIRAVTIDTLMEGLSSLTYILSVAVCTGDQINHIFSSPEPKAHKVSL